MEFLYVNVIFRKGYRKEPSFACSEYRRLQFAVLKWHPLCSAGNLPVCAGIARNFCTRLWLQNTRLTKRFYEFCFWQFLLEFSFFSRTASAVLIQMHFCRPLWQRAVCQWTQYALHEAPNTSQDPTIWTNHLKEESSALISSDRAPNKEPRFEVCKTVLQFEDSCYERSIQ